jgi:hypothetical protein
MGLAARQLHEFKPLASRQGFECIDEFGREAPKFSPTGLERLRDLIGNRLILNANRTWRCRRRARHTRTLRRCPCRMGSRDTLSLSAAVPRTPLLQPLVGVPGAGSPCGPGVVWWNRRGASRVWYVCGGGQTFDTSPVWEGPRGEVCPTPASRPRLHATQVRPRRSARTA